MSFKTFIKNLPLIGPVVRRIGTLRTRVPAGHFYSPIVSVNEVKSREGQIYSPASRILEGIELNEDSQLQFLKDSYQNYGKELVFPSQKSEGNRYYFENDYFKLPDATSLYLILRTFKPNRVIEVGSGFSSAVTLDTVDRFFIKKPELTFIEPYPKRLKSLLRSEDKNVIILENFVQDIPIEKFKTLQANDILFIDSTHVSKTGSDVNFLLFDVLPALNPGVIIHIHDIFYPFEYPKDWVIYGNGRFGWNEAYLLRAFLSNQTSYEIILHNHFLQTFHKDWFFNNIPTYANFGNGGSIWLRKN